MPSQAQVHSACGQLWLRAIVLARIIKWLNEPHPRNYAAPSKRLVRPNRESARVPTKYLFADESGNFDFRCHIENTGPTRFFAVGTLLVEGDAHVRALRSDLLSLRDELVRRGANISGPFHCTEDDQAVRDAVFELLQGHDFTVDVTVLEKAKAQPHTRATDAHFYKYAWFYHFKHFARHYFRPDDDLMVMSAGLGTRRTKAAFRGAVEDVVRQCCSWQVNKRFGHWEAAADPGLWAVDYALWAVMREVERGDARSRVLLDDKIASVYDLWKVGRKYYYGPMAQKSA